MFTTATTKGLAMVVSGKKHGTRSERLAGRCYHTVRPCFGEATQSMSTNAHCPDEPDEPHDSLVASLTNRLARSFTIGTDEEGYRHHYYAPADTVVVWDADGVDHRERLDGDLLETWVAFVHARRGWATKGPHARNGIAHDRQRKQEDA